MQKKFHNFIQFSNSYLGEINYLSQMNKTLLKDNTITLFYIFSHIHKYNNLQQTVNRLNEEEYLKLFTANYDLLDENPQQNFFSNILQHIEQQLQYVQNNWDRQAWGDFISATIIANEIADKISEKMYTELAQSLHKQKLSPKMISKLLSIYDKHYLQYYLLMKIDPLSRNNQEDVKKINIENFVITAFDEIKKDIKYKTHKYYTAQNSKRRNKYVLINIIGLFASFFAASYIFKNMFWKIFTFCIVPIFTISNIIMYLHDRSHVNNTKNILFKAENIDLTQIKSYENIYKIGAMLPANKTDSMLYEINEYADKLNKQTKIFNEYIEQCIAKFNSIMNKYNITIMLDNYLASAQESLIQKKNDLEEAKELTTPDPNFKGINIAEEQEYIKKAKKEWELCQNPKNEAGAYAAGKEEENAKLPQEQFTDSCSLQSNKKHFITDCSKANRVQI